MATRALSIATIICIGCVVDAATAQDICVTCQRPDATYACAIDAPAGGAHPPKATKLLRFTCIQDIAKTYGHEVCRVRRDMVGPCIGKRHLIALGSEATTPSPDTVPPGIPDTVPPPTSEGERAGPAPVPSPSKPENSEPRTVVEMAKEATKSSEKQMEKAGEAMSGTLSKTWRCITSLFSDC